MSPADTSTAAANERTANLVESASAGHLDAQRLIFAIREGGNGAQLLQEAIERIVALHDVDRLSAFSRSLAKALR